MKHTPLETATLSQAAQRALGPGPGRMMAARGMMPLAPADQVAVLYQLSLDGDTTTATAARATASQLPEKLLLGTLADPKLDARVLDFFAVLVGKKAALFDAIALNPAIADETIADLAAHCGAREVDQLAQNEQRLLRHPEIIGAMYMNKHARMSTVDRVVELAVRNKIRVPGLAAWDEVARALQGAPATTSEDDHQFATLADQLTGDDSALTVGDADQVLEDPEEELTLDPAEDTQSFAKMSTPNKIRLATIGNAFARNVLIRDPVRLVAVAAIKSPGVTEIEAARYAANVTLPEDVIRYIAGKREWTKRYGVKVALCRNPKTSVPDVTRLLPFLRPKDLANIAKSKGVASAVVAQARKLMSQRQGPTNK
jgi:hypothetical protein